MISVRRVRRLIFNTHIKDICKGTKQITQATKMSAGPVETSLRTKLYEHLKPVHLDVINESYMHNVPKGSERHFKVIVVSDLFNDKSLLQRHQMVNSVLAEELKTVVHALSIVAKTPSQWTESTKVSKSPPCEGGFNK